MARGIVQGVRKNGRAFVMFFLGICIGGAMILFLYGEKIDGFILERNAIYYANNQKYKEILKLQEELGSLTEKGRNQTQQKEIIKKIKVEVDFEDRLGTEAIVEQVEKMLDPFLDKSMKWVSDNPDLVEIVINNQTIPIHEQGEKVKLHVKYLSLYDSTLKIWVKAEKNSNEGVSDSAE